MRSIYQYRETNGGYIKTICAPPRGLEPLTLSLQVPSNYFKAWTISSPYLFKDLGVGCLIGVHHLVSAPSSRFARLGSGLSFDFPQDFPELTRFSFQHFC